MLVNPFRGQETLAWDPCKEGQEEAKLYSNGTPTGLMSLLLSGFPYRSYSLSGTVPWATLCWYHFSRHLKLTPASFVALSGLLAHGADTEGIRGTEGTWRLEGLPYNSRQHRVSGRTGDQMLLVCHCKAVLMV